MPEGRRPLGGIDLNATQRAGTEAPDRDAVEPGSVRWLQGLERARQRAAAGPDPRVVTVCGREGGLWERFGPARAGGGGLLVRSDRGRQRRILRSDGSVADLWEAVAEPRVPGTKTIHLVAGGGPRPRLKRTVVLELRAAAVHLVPPKDRADRTPMPMLAVSVRGARPPRGRDPLHGVLRSTEGEADLRHARRRVAGYEARGPLEDYFEAYFRVLKVGARIEERKLPDADDLRTCLAFDAIPQGGSWTSSAARATCPTAPPSMSSPTAKSGFSTDGSGTIASSVPRPGRRPASAPSRPISPAGRASGPAGAGRFRVLRTSGRRGGHSRPDSKAPDPKDTAQAPDYVNHRKGRWNGRGRARARRTRMAAPRDPGGPGRGVPSRGSAAARLLRSRARAGRGPGSSAARVRGRARARPPGGHTAGPGPGLQSSFAGL